MDDTSKQRVVGLCILVFLAVVFVPFVFDGKGLKKEQSKRGEILNLPTNQPEKFTTVLTLDKPSTQSTTLKPLPKPPVVTQDNPKPLQHLPQDTKPTSALTLLPKTEAKPKAQKPKSVKPAKTIQSPKLVKEKPAKAKKPVVKTVKKTAKKPKSGWLVQVGGFSKKQNAWALKKKLEQQGFTAFVKTNSAGNFFRVRVGVYATKERALKARAKLAKLHKVKPILVKL